MFAQHKVEHVPLGVGLWQGSSLSHILFVIFMDRISSCCLGEESVRFSDLRIASLLFAEDVKWSGRESAPPCLRHYMEWEVDRWSGAASAGMQALY